MHSCFRIDSEENNKYNKNAEFVSIIFKSQRIQEFKEFFDNYTFNQYKIYKNQIDDFMSQIFKYMIEDFSEIRQFFYCTIAVKKLINQLEPIPINNNNIKISNEYKIISYIEEHYRENITLDTLSKELYINKFTVSKIFSEQIGVRFQNLPRHNKKQYCCKINPKYQRLTRKHRVPCLVLAVYAPLTEHFIIISE